MNKGILLLGHKSHGKEELIKELNSRYGYTFGGSKNYHCRRIVFPRISIKYSTPEECYLDRDNHREEWFNIISDYNGDDLSRVIRDVFREFDGYNGLRCNDEFQQAKSEGIIKKIIWIDASRRKPNEPTMKISKPDNAYTVNNDGTISDLHSQVDALHDFLIK